jgi:hypothetical protein
MVDGINILGTSITKTAAALPAKHRLFLYGATIQHFAIYGQLSINHMK